MFLIPAELITLQLKKASIRKEAFNFVGNELRRFGGSPDTSFKFLYKEKNLPGLEDLGGLEDFWNLFFRNLEIPKFVGDTVPIAIGRTSDPYLVEVVL